MKRIATLTVNPTIDKNTRVDLVVPNRKLRCERPVREPGGGGINVSRAVHRLGGTSDLLYLGGGPLGDMLEHLLDEEGLSQVRIPIEGWTRENLMVYEERGDQQFRFGMPGPEVRESEWRRCLEELSRLDPAPDFVVASGSLPPGVPADFYGRVGQTVQDMGARLIVDTSGEALRHAVDTGAFLLKPNIRELQDLVGEELGDETEQKEAARQVIAKGRASVIVLSLGRAGALVITAERSEFVRTPSVPIRSKVGAGDSMVAGMVLGLARDMELMDAVRFGVAAGAAAVMTEGTELCRREDAERIYRGMVADG